LDTRILLNNDERAAQSPECGMLWIKYPLVKRRGPAITVVLANLVQQAAH
jgi:hypothetical protein